MVKAQLVLILLMGLGVASAQNPPAEGREPNWTQEFSTARLDLADIRDSSAKDVGEVLAVLEGISKIRKGGIANDVVLRGFQQDNLNVLIDGTHVYGACPNNMDPASSHVDFAEVNRIEVTKGPFDVRSQGGVGGAVRVITQEEEVLGLRVVPSFSTASFSFYNPSLGLSGASRKFHYSAGYAYRISDPYRDGQDRRFTSYGNYRTGEPAKAFDGHTGWGSVSFTPAGKQRLDIGYSRQQNGLTLYPYLMMDAVYDNADRATVKYIVRDVLPAAKQIRVEAYATKVNHLMDDARRTTSGASQFSMLTQAVTSAWGARAEAELGSDVTVGIESSRRSWDALTWMQNGAQVQRSIPNVSITSLGGFVDFSRNLSKRVRITSGMRFDHVTSDGTLQGNSSNLYLAYHSVPLRRVVDNVAGGNARISVRAGHGLELFIGAGSMARVPDPQERFFSLQRMGQDWVGNPTLRRTRNTETDAGIGFRRGNATARVTAYYSALSGLSTLHRQRRESNVPGVMNSVAQSYINTNARQYGAEASFSLAFGSNLALSGGASITRGSKDRIPPALVLDSNISELPAAGSRLDVRYARKWMFAQVGGSATGAQRRIDRDLNEQVTPGYGLLNAKIGIHTSRLNINASIDNLLNRFYYESFSYRRDPFRSGVKVPEPGRTVSLNLSCRL